MSNNRHHQHLKMLLTLNDIVGCTRCEDGWRHKVGNCIYCGGGPAPGDMHAFQLGWKYPCPEGDKEMRLGVLVTGAMRQRFAPKMVYQDNINPILDGDMTFQKIDEH